MTGASLAEERGEATAWGGTRALRGLCASLLLAAASASCLVDADVVRIPVEDIRSLLLLTFADDGSPPEIRAEVIAEGASFATVPAPRDGRVRRLIALEYRCPLDVLGLEPGPVELASADTGDPLPRPAAAVLAGVVGPGALPILAPSSWTPELDALSIKTRLDPSTHCVGLKTNFVRLADDTNDDVRLAMRLDGDRILISTRKNGLFLLTGLSATPLPRPPIEPRGGFRTSSGEVWLADRRGSVVRGDPLTGAYVEAPPLVATTTTSSISEWVHLDGDPDGGAADLFAVADDDSFQRFTGARWEVVALPVEPKESTRASLAWIGPSRAIAAGLLNTDLVRYDRGAVSFEKLPLTSSIDPQARSIARIEDFGLVAGTRQGELFVAKDADSPFRLLGRATIRDRISAIARLGRGLAFGADNGNIAQWQPPGTICPPISYTVGTILRMVATEDALVIEAERPRGEPLSLVVLTKEPRPYERCGR